VLRTVISRIVVSMDCESTQHQECHKKIEFQARRYNRAHKLAVPMRNWSETGVASVLVALSVDTADS
jgi:hypothetical protein